MSWKNTSHRIIQVAIKIHTRDALSCMGCKFHKELRREIGSEMYPKTEKWRDSCKLFEIHLDNFPKRPQECLDCDQGATNE